jgi:hypothetical protein
LRKFGVWSRDKRALSPIFATVLLATIIIVFGSVAYYFSSNITQTATNNYVKTLSDSQQAIAERIGFENIDYTSSTSTSPATLKIFVINCGSANNVKINSVFIYDRSHSILGAYSVSYKLSSSVFQISDLYSMEKPLTDNALNVGQEGYFIVTLSPSPSPALTPGLTYTIHLITQSGSSFDHDFTA